jgi:hypothetical protein
MNTQRGPRECPNLVWTDLAERLCWQAACRDDARVARRLYRKPVVDGVYRLDEGALLDDFFYFLHELGVVDWLDNVQGTAVQREMVPFVQYLLRYSLKTLCGIESRHAFPPCCSVMRPSCAWWASMRSRCVMGCANGAPRHGRGRAAQGPSENRAGGARACDVYCAAVRLGNCLSVAM